MKTLQQLIIGILVLISGTVLGQQEVSFTFYKQHMNIVNPAYVGLDSLTLATGTIRKQWTGIKDAPETQTISFGMPAWRSLGVGVFVINDKVFVEKRTLLGLDFSYNLRVGSAGNLYFGIRGAANFYDLNTANLQTYSTQADPSLGSVNRFAPNVGLGTVYRNGPMYLSLSIPKLLKTKRDKNEENYASIASDSPHLYLSGGYDIDMLEQTGLYLVIKPSFMFRYVNGAPISADFTSLVEIDEKVEIGGMYRTDQAYAAMATVRIASRFLFGYAYEVSTRTELAGVRNSNEILFQFRF